MLLFPSDPFQPSIADEAYLEEWHTAQTLGQSCALFSLEDLKLGLFKPKPAITPGTSVLYRGWMLTPNEYAQLHAAITDKGGKPLVSPAQYRHAHYLPEWYAMCRDCTPETLVLPRESDFVAALAEHVWPAYFVKDYVKSLTTERGSIATSSEQVAQVVALLEHYRGGIEGGVCIRRFEHWQIASEERFFVLHGQAYARDGKPPELAHTLAKRIDSPFFSMDLVLAQDGKMRLIEIGDGQVSDRKKWPVQVFFDMLAQM